MLRWKIPSAVFYDRCAEQLSEVMPDFIQVLERQLQMYASGVSLPLHDAAAVGHTKDGLYGKWLFCEGVLLTQPSLRGLLTATLRQYHKTSVHPGAVGIICLSRPEVLLSDLSLESQVGEGPQQHRSAGMHACLQGCRSTGPCARGCRLAVKLCSAGGRSQKELPGLSVEF
jgi:hypothetical protein